MAAILVVFWIYHEKLKEQIKYGEGIIKINWRHLDRISGNWSGFADVGSEFVNHDHPYGSDLDIVGKKSIFQFLNTTHTWHGRQKFVADLLSPHYSDEEIIQRQVAITELSEDISFSNHIEYKYSQIGVHAGTKLIAKRLKNATPFMKNNALKLLVIYAPLGVLLFSGVAVLTGATFLYPAVAILAICQLLVWVLSFLKVANYLEDVAHLSYNLNEYSEVVNALQSRHFKADKLKEIQKCLVNSDRSAALAIKELGQISNRASLRRNVVVWMTLNIILLWDLTTAIRFEAWKQKYAGHAESWFISLGEFESLLSFSHLPNVINETCKPTLVGNKIVEAKNLGHPLITNEKRVSNDVACKDHIFIISGSNMSGKTTFMRTIGVNLILARAGSFVCAKEMNCSQLELMTSMRIADNLSEGISTFYAELKRVKGIIAKARKEPQMMFLIDEIFRGTNSVDRLVGAKTVLEKLDELGVIGIITTHDLELCDISNDYLRIKNYSFSEYYHDNEIHFDYEMKAGISTTTNAKYLMKMIDII
jgi:ABC-type lipoprotein export system ATPase subunit